MWLTRNDHIFSADFTIIIIVFRGIYELLNHKKKHKLRQKKEIQKWKRDYFYEYVAFIGDIFSHENGIWLFEISDMVQNVSNVKISNKEVKQFLNEMFWDSIQFYDPAILVYPSEINLKTSLTP